MIRWMSRHLIGPLHERLLGRPTFRDVRRLEETQWLAPDEVRALQREKLRELFLHASRNIPFYRPRIDQVSVNGEGDDPLEVLHGLPLLTKQDIRRNLETMLWRDAPGGLFPRNTGGSTGEPLNFFFDRRRQACDQAARIRSHRWFGCDLGDRELYLWGSPIELTTTDAVKRFRDSLFNQRLLNAFDMSPRRMNECLNVWDRYRPHCLFGYPSSIGLLAEHARALGRQLDTRCLRAVFVTGEVCHPYQRENIADYFGVPVADGYGSREGGFIAHQCPFSNVHVTAEHVVVEVIDADGRLLPYGQTGEIVVTHLDNYAMPFIRYRTGDIGRLRAGRCACGRGLPLMDVVQGRSTDFLCLPDGTIKHALSIIYPLRETRGVRQFHVTQREDFSVLVEIVRDESGPSISSGLIVDRVRPVMGDAVVLDVRFVENLRVVASGKHRQVISHARRPLSIFPFSFQGEGRGAGLVTDSVRFSGLPHNLPAHPEPEPSAEIATRV